MDLPKCRINRQIARLEKEYLTWPDWMKRKSYMQVTKTTSCQKYVDQVLTRNNCIKGWVTSNVTSSGTDILKTETTIKLKNGNYAAFFVVQEGDEENFAEFFENIAKAIKLTLEESKNG